MARAKNTDRAEARRRHRDTQRVEDAADMTVIDADAPSAAAAPTLSGGTTMRSSLRMPNVREDLRILPGMLVSTKKLWIPFIALFAAFVVAMLLSVGNTHVVVIGSQSASYVTDQLIPAGIDRMAALFVQLTLPPTALFIFFIGGFLAPRASYLVGALLGVIDGILWSIYVLVAQSTIQDGLTASSPSDIVVIIVIAVVIGTLAAGFAAWYRNFLRQSQERAKQNRAARDQAARAKAKEDERKAREEQRAAAAAARETAKSTAKGTKPTG